MPDLHNQVRAARLAAGLTVAEAAATVGVSPAAWNRWEGNNSTKVEIPYAAWNLFLLLNNQHPLFVLTSKK